MVVVSGVGLGIVLGSEGEVGIVLGSGLGVAIVISCKVMGEFVDCGEWRGYCKQW